MTLPKKPLISVRFNIVMLASLAAALMYALRYNLSIAIIAMVKPSQLSAHSTNATDDVTIRDLGQGCPASEQQNRENETSRYVQGTQYNWDPSMQGNILSAYFVGYTITQIIGGRFAEKRSSKWAVGLGILLSSIGTILTPISAQFGQIIMWSIRFLIGCFHGLVYTGIYTLIGRWVPKDEKATAIATVMAISQFGAALAYPVVGYICDTAEWQISFYVLGVSGVLWFVAWTWYATDCPDDHKRICSHELSVIRQGCPKINASGNIVSIPWAAVVTSRGVWASSLGKLTYAFVYYVVGTMLPSYLANVLNVDLRHNGLMNAGIYVSIGFSMVISGPLSDWMAKKNYLSLTTIRKSFHAFATGGSGLALLAIPFVGCDVPVVLKLLFVSMFFYGFIGAGESPLPADFAPEMSGTIFGICNTFACVSGFLAPVVCGWIVNDDIHSRHKWNMVFYLSIGLYAVGIVAFSLLADAKPDPRFRITRKEKAQKRNGLDTECVA